MLIKRKVFFSNIINMVLILFVILQFFVFKNPNILFWGNILVCIFICLKAKISLYSIKAILVNYVLISLFFQYNYHFSYGILQISSYNLNYTTMNMLALIYTSIISFYLINSNYLEEEKSKQLYNCEFTSVAYLIISVMAIVFAIIAFPHFINSSAARFDSLLPGNGWNHCTIICLLLVMPGFYKNKFVKFSYIFCILWFLLQGERVDMIGLLFCLIAILAAKKSHEIKQNKMILIMKYAILCSIIFFTMIFIGEIRSGQKEISLSTIVQKALIQNTAADIGYVYNISIKHRYDYGLLYGKTYSQYLFDAVPLFSVNTIDKQLYQKYGSPGGIFILSEPYMNFGVVGVIIFAIIEITIINLITRNKSKYSYFLYLYIFATLFRTSWYGLWYIETGVIYILPILYLIANSIGRRTNKK